MSEHHPPSSNQNVEKSNPLIYLIVFAAASALVFWAFASFFKVGAESAKSAPPKPIAAKPAGAVDMSKLYSADPELVAKGKMLYAINCASCHGPTGKGDGDRAAELNPKPRNYATEKFKFGSSPSNIWNTLKTGSPGTAMASFELLPPEDRIAIIHYVLTLVPKPDVDSPETIAKLTGGGTGAVTDGGMSSASTGTTEGPRIPITLALAVSAHSEVPSGKKLARLPAGEGREIYEVKCAFCHGASGEGGEPVGKLAVFPYVYAKAPSLQNPKALWLKDKKEFEKIVVGGLAGRMMPGTVLTSGELDALYRYVAALANQR